MKKKYDPATAQPSNEGERLVFESYEEDVHMCHHGYRLHADNTMSLLSCCTVVVIAGIIAFAALASATYLIQII